jgi:hypothetical protein
VIDLHLHTTASDGRSSPEALVREAAAAGVTVLAVTDHDTVAAVPAVREAAAEAGLRVITGIEITAVEDARDVHVLGYGFDPDDDTLAAFLADQRAIRRRRLIEIIRRLDELGRAVDIEPLLAAAGSGAGQAVGRPVVARALVDAGYVADVAEAFERYLAEGRPAFVPRAGSSVEAVVDLVAAAGGVASIAHPGKMGRDDLVERLLAARLPAVEAFHPDHDPADAARYLDMARRAGRLVTGGSDYHGPGSGRTSGLGAVGLPREHFERLAAHAGWA